MRDIEIQVTRTFLAGRDGNSNNITTSETEPLPSVHLGSNPQCETICVVYQCRNFFFSSYVLRGKFQKKEGGNENI